MKLSKYTIIKENYPIKNFSLLYNTLTKGISIVNVKDIENILSNEIEKVKKEILNPLKEEGFIVKLEDDEISKLNMFFTDLKTSYHAYATMILTSYDCNMRCSYCFEDGIKERNENMSLETANSIVEWLYNEFYKYKPKNLGIAFSGGEPLINKEPIEFIIKKMKAFSDANVAGFSFGFLTNGTIDINKSEAEMYLENGMEFIQYTIDGDRRIHDKRRYIENGSYDMILKNIERNDKLMNVNTIIRMNIDRENKDNLDQLFDDIQLLEINKSNVTFDFANRFETFHNVHDKNKNVLTANEFTEVVTKCFVKTNEIGFNHSRRYANNSPCLAITPRQFIIDPVGDLYKCAAFAGEKKFSVASVYEEEMNDVYIDMVGLDAWHDCKDCVYVPLCAGGCMWLNRNAYGDYRKKQCQFNLFDNLVMETLASTLDKESSINKLVRNNL